MEHEGDDTKCNRYARYRNQTIGVGTGSLGNKMTKRDHQNYSIVEIEQNPKKNLGDLRRFAVTQIPVKNYQLTLVWKTLKEEKKLII